MVQATQGENMLDWFFVNTYKQMKVPNELLEGSVYSPVQRKQIKFHLKTTKRRGLYGQDPYGCGGHYVRAEDNPFLKNGINCQNCAFYLAGQEDDQRAEKSDLPIGQCCIMDTQGSEANYIHPAGWCKFWVVPEDLIPYEPHWPENVA